MRKLLKSQSAKLSRGSRERRGNGRKEFENGKSVGKRSGRRRSERERSEGINERGKRSMIDGLLSDSSMQKMKERRRVSLREKRVDMRGRRGREGRDGKKSRESRVQ